MVLLAIAVAMLMLEVPGPVEGLRCRWPLSECFEFEFGTQGREGESNK